MWRKAAGMISGAGLANAANG